MTSTPRTLALSALVALALVPLPADAEVNRYIVDTGPLRIRDQFLLGMGYLAFDPVSADVQKAGDWQLDFVMTVTNTFAHSQAVEEMLDERGFRSKLSLDQLREITPKQPGAGVFHLDGELYRSVFTARRGIGKGIQLEIAVPVLSFQGGVVDSTIEGFHDTFGFGQAGRTGVPRDGFQAYARGSNGEVFIDNDPGLALGDVVIGSKIRLIGDRSERPLRLAIEGLAKLPTGNQHGLSSSGSYDFGAQLLSTRYFAKACLHASVGLLYLGDWDALGIDAQTLGSGMVAYEHALGSLTSGLLQLTVSQSPFDDLRLDELAETSIQLTLGVKRVIRGQQVLFVGLTENLQNFNNTADLGFHIGLTQTLD